MMTADFCSVFFGMLGLVLSIAMHERKIIRGEDRNVNYLDIYNCICTSFLILSIFIKYNLQLKWSVSVSMYTQYDSLRTTGLWKSMAFEIILCSMATYPFLVGIEIEEYVAAYEETIKYTLNEILLSIMFVRLYLPARLSFYMTDFMNPRTQRVCVIHGCKFS